MLCYVQLRNSCWSSLGLRPESKCDFAEICNRLALGAATLCCLFLWLWHVPKRPPSKYHIQVLSTHMQSKCNVCFFSRNTTWTFGSVISQMRVSCSRAAPIPSLLWNVYSPTCLVLTGNKFHIGAFCKKALPKFGPAIGLTASTRSPSPCCVLWLHEALLVQRYPVVMQLLLSWCTLAPANIKGLILLASG